MLKKENRGLSNSEIKFLLEKGRIVQTPLFGFRFVMDSGSQLGWIVSKKISKKAVERNRIKRKLTQAIGKQIPLGIKGVFLVKGAMMGAKMKEVEDQVNFVLGKIEKRT